MQLADVALPVPIARLFSYAIPEAIATRLVVGSRALCTLGSRKIVGVVLGVREGEPPPNVKPVLSVLDGPSLPLDLVTFVREVAAYYMAPIGEVVRLSLPPVDKETSRAMQEPELFAPTARGVGARKVKWILAGDVSGQEARAKADGAESSSAAAMLAHVRALGAVPLARLEERFKNARAATKKLAAQGLLTIEERAAVSDPFFAEPQPHEPAPVPTAPQAAAILAIETAIASSTPKTFLLHGVTGSGKTEVYLSAIAATRAAKKGSIVLVPEIALTPQLVARFRGRFGDDVAVLHSGLTPRERFDMWRRLREGEVDVAIGARSALFAPVRDLGLIVVDEEHDPSFKQEEGVRYHARDMAILRTHRAGGVCILGSATPSLESEQLSRTGKVQKIVLPDRARAQAMPKVEIVDLRRIGAGPTGDKRISIPLHRAIETTLAAKGQAILFLNRRGFSPAVRCETCGEMAACPQCSVALTFHKRGGAVLRCHYCDYEQPMLVACKKCNSPELAMEGLGTEKLEDTLRDAFPEARVARLDRDVASGSATEKILARMRSREIDLLVGTQMVTKGHDLPHVTLVGVINADAALSIPDFRSSERAFQLLVQVAGRAGRGDSPGRVLVQTYDPEHHAIAFGKQHDVDGFLARELIDRRELGYPPFSRVALVRVDAMDERAAHEACAMLARVAREAASAEGFRVDVLGPAPAPIARLRNRYRFRIMLRAPDRGELRRVLLAVDRNRVGLARDVRSSIDVDPVGLM